MKNADIKAGDRLYTHVLLVKKISKNQLHVFIADGINAEDMDTEIIKVLCHVKILFGIKEISVLRKEVKK